MPKTFRLVDAFGEKSKQPLGFEVKGYLYYRYGRKPCIGRWVLSMKDLNSFGLPRTTGSCLHLRLLPAAKPGSAIILESFNSPNVRLASDMRRNRKWLKSLPTLRENIQAIFKERDRLTALTGIKHEVDHIHPVNHPLLCGLTVPWNLQVIPAVENKRKGNSLDF